MTQTGRMTAFDALSGEGLVQPDDGGKALRFHHRSLDWRRARPPEAGQHFLFDLSTNEYGKPCAINLRVD